MNIGSIGYACHNGLGHLMRDFYRNGILNRIILVRHRNHQNYPDWYPKEVIYTTASIDKFLDGLDTLLLFETAFFWGITEEARKRNIRIVLIPMYEYTPCPAPGPIDHYLCPSLLDLEIFKDYSSSFLPIPVPSTVNPWQRKVAHKFVHNMGHGQHGYAKGTYEIIEAMKYVKSPMRLLIRAQTDDPRASRVYREFKDFVRLEWQIGNLPDEEVFKEGDVYLNAEQFNGLSLPLLEAYASGMVVMTSDRYPANTWLPKGPLIPVSHYGSYKIPGGSNVTFQRAIVSPRDIAMKIDEWYGKDIHLESYQNIVNSQLFSWEQLKPKYLEILKG